MQSLKFAIKLLVLLALFSQILAGLQNMECTDDQQCRDAYTSHYHCSVDRICYYSPVSFSLLEVAGLLTMIAVVTLSNSGAVGAGITIMPIIMVFLEFVVGDAIAYARLTILTGSFVTFVISGFKRSTTDPNKFWTSYSLAAVMGPLLLAGSMIGVMIGNWLPGISIGGILAVYLVVSLIQCFIRAKEEQAAEKKKREDTQALDNDLGQIVSPSNVYLPLHDRPKDDKNIETSFESDRHLAMISRTNVTPDVKSMCAMLVEHLPNFLLIILAMALFTLITLLRGGNAFRSIIGIPECQTDSYLILIGGQVFFLGLAIACYIYNSKLYNLNTCVFFPILLFSNSDSVFCHRNTLWHFGSRRWASHQSLHAQQRLKCAVDRIFVDIHRADLKRLDMSSILRIRLVTIRVLPLFHSCCSDRIFSRKCHIQTLDHQN
jgi:Sulfite exporter TauE/SafE